MFAYSKMGGYESIEEEEPVVQPTMEHFRSRHLVMERIKEGKFHMDHVKKKKKKRKRKRKKSSNIPIPKK